MRHAPRWIALLIVAGAGCGPTTRTAAPPVAPVAPGPRAPIGAEPAPTVADVAASTGGPSVAPGDPQEEGYIDGALIRRLIRRELGRIRYCYEKALLAAPGLEGTVMVKFTITTSGAVGDASATGLTPAVATCVVDVIKSIAFPQPETGIVTITWPFRFSPND